MKKIMAILLSVVMVTCFMPAMAFATDITDPGITIAAIPDQTYTGSEIKPTVTVTSGGAVLVEKRDYELVYSNNTSAGDATITVSGAGVVTGTTNVSFKINPKAITATGVVISPMKTQVVGSTVTDVAIKDGTKTLVKGTDYTITASAVTLGVNNLQIGGIGNYTGVVTYQYKGGTDISNYTIYWPAQTKTYNGTKQTLSGVQLRNPSGTAISSSNYTVSYDKNINAGLAKVIVEGTGDYAGTTEASFTIDAKALTSTMLQPIDNAISGNNPNVVVKDGATTLNSASDYSVLYVGTATGGSVTITGKNNYKGQITGTYKNGISIETATVVLDNPSYVYDGSVKTPKAVVSIYNVVYKEGTDYRLEYVDNAKQGTAKVRVIGKGSYAGTIEKTFTIDKLDLSKCTMTVSPTSNSYTGSQVKPVVTLTYAGRNISSYDYNVVYSNNTYVGNALVTVYSKYNDLTGSFNTTGSQYKFFTIGGTSLAYLPATLEKTLYLYDGIKKEPKVTVKSGTKVLTLGTDYTVTYSNNINSGTGTVKITGKGIYTGEQNINFTISGKTQTVSTNYTKYTRYLTSSIFALGVKATGDGTGFNCVSSDPTVATVTNNGYVEIKGTGIANITVTTVGNKAYNPASKTVTVTVKPSKVTPKLYSTSKGKMRVRITKNSGVTKYQIRYGRAGVYKYYYMNYANDSYTTQSKLLKGLKSGYKYFVKVRPYKLAADGVTKIYGNWSSVKSIRIK